MSRFARSKHLFSQLKKDDLGKRYLLKTKSAIIEDNPSNNYFIDYVLNGTYTDLSCGPLYLQRDNFEIIRQRVARIEIVHNDILDYLKKSENDCYDKFNLSNIFEPLSNSDTVKIFCEISRTGKQGGRVIWWNNAVERGIPSHFKKQFNTQGALQQLLRKEDRMFFYQGCNVVSIEK